MFTFCGCDKDKTCQNIPMIGSCIKIRIKYSRTFTGFTTKKNIYYIFATHCNTAKGKPGLYNHNRKLQHQQPPYPSRKNKINYHSCNDLIKSIRPQFKNEVYHVVYRCLHYVFTVHVIEVDHYTNNSIVTLLVQWTLLWSV